MKAGAFTPAIPLDTRRTCSGRPALNEGGGFHPRDPRPPRPTADASCCCPAPLNEGGGFHPRDPLESRPFANGTDATTRSMKAGAFTPAIHESVTLPSHAIDVLDDRSMKAGAFTPAIPGRHRDSHVLLDDRSMKAGAFTPAIHHSSTRYQRHYVLDMIAQ